MKITHLQSSSQLISLGNVSVLTDPWLTDGEYFGSWYHYPPFPEKELKSLKYDYIYVSHIHPDHLSEETFHKLPYKKPVLIHNYDAKFLKRKLETIGYPVIECDHAKPFEFENGSKITIYAADNCNPEVCNMFMGCGSVEKKFGSTQIDTMAMFEFMDIKLLNTNDCPFELALHTIKKNQLDKEDIDLLLVGYAGAGPYPQCFEFNSPEEKEIAAAKKEKSFIDQAVKYIELLRPRDFAPFAGTYVLGSRLSALNQYRGVSSVADATNMISARVEEISRGVLLEQLDIYDISARSKLSSAEKFPLNETQFLDLISKKPLSYDNDDWDDDELFQLIISAYDRFKSKADEIAFDSGTAVIIESQKIRFKFSLRSGVEIIAFDVDVAEPFVRIRVDHNLLHRLLQGPRFAHWNNAEIGSHLTYLRKPDRFERGLYHCMCFFHQ